MLSQHYTGKDKVKAQEKLQKIGTHAGKYRYIMMPELYTSLSQEKVIKH